MKRALIALFAFCMMSALSAFAADKGSWTGYIADEKCGAKAAAPGQEACTKKCIESGAKAVFVTDDKKEVIPIHNQDAVKGHEGHHVKVSGSLDNNELHVDKVEMLASAKKAGDKKEHAH